MTIGQLTRPEAAATPPRPGRAAPIEQATAPAPSSAAGADAPGADGGASADGAVVEVLQACARRVAQEQARMLAAMVAVQNEAVAQERRDTALTGREHWGQWAGAEIGAALTWTTGKADGELSFAQFLVEGLPSVFAELATGRIDHGRAWTFVDVLQFTDITEDQLARVCAAVVPQAHKLTSGRIRARLLRLLIAIDPDYAARRYRKAVRERLVRGWFSPDGTATIHATGLTVDEAAASTERVERLADAVKAAGHPATVRQIRVDLFTRLLDGRLHGMNHEQMIAAMLNDPTTHPDHDPAPTGEEAGAEAVSADDLIDPPDATDGADMDSDSGSGSALSDSLSDSNSPSARWGCEVRVGLGTLIGLDEQPGEIPGWGPVIAPAARVMAARQHRAEWRFAVTDAEGQLVLAGVTRRRPRDAGEQARECVGGIVEIDVCEAELTFLAAAMRTNGPWAGVVADIADQHAHRHALQRRLDAHPGDRFAHAALRRHVQIRDRTCIAPGCSRPARRCDQDHTLAHESGGLTTACNLECLCKRHHRMKHDGRWRLEQPEPGRFCWTSPFGRVYRTSGEPIIPPAIEPAPRDPEPDTDEPATGDLDGPILRRPPPAPPPAAPPPPEDLDDGPPPF